MLKNENRFFKHCFFRVLLLIATGPVPDVSAQNNLPGHSFSVEVKDRPLDELLATISEKSGVIFSYNPKKISAEKVVSFSVTNQTVTEILTLLSKRFDIAYTLVENQVILKPEKRKEQNTLSFTISGTVTDVNNGEALIGATLILKELQIGTTTNPFGFFSITVPKGTYHLVCSYIGYRELEAPVNLQSHIKEDLSLQEAVPVLQEIVVTNTHTDIVREIRSGTTNVRPGAVVERPAFFGEMDVVKSLESLPGIKLHSDGSTFYYVRGGNRDQISC